MSLFHRKTTEEKRLDAILSELKINMSNNYKDNACACFREFTEAFSEVKKTGVLNPKALAHYEELYADYSGKMAGYSHNAQKPYWTREDLPQHRGN